MKTIKLTLLTTTALFVLLFGFSGNSISSEMNKSAEISNNVKPGPKYVWVPGHYKHNKHGKLVWIPGHWKRV